MGIIGDLAQFRLMGYLTPSDFVMTQMGIGAFRETGRDFQKNVNKFLGKHFYDNGSLKPFLNGAGSVAKDLLNAAKGNPMYVAAAGAGSYGLYQLGKIMEAHAYPADLPLGKRVQQGFKDNISGLTDAIFENPLYTISGVAAAGILGKILYDNHQQKNHNCPEKLDKSKAV